MCLVIGLNKIKILWNFQVFTRSIYKEIPKKKTFELCENEPYSNQETSSISNVSKFKGKWKMSLIPVKKFQV